MLLRSNISTIEIYSEEWKTARLGKITASNVHHLMGEKLETQGAESYLYDLVGEEISGIPADEDIDNDDTRAGHLYEPECIRKFGKKMQLTFMVVGKMIAEPGARTSCTPDALWIENETPDQKAYSVRTVEAKCPTKHKNYIRLARCTTPAQVKAVSKKYFWQVVMQMEKCGALYGYLVVYNPHYPVGGMRIIEFRKMLMLKEFAFFNQRLKEAEILFDKIKKEVESIS